MADPFAGGIDLLKSAAVLQSPLLPQAIAQAQTVLADQKIAIERAQQFLTTLNQLVAIAQGQ